MVFYYIFLLPGSVDLYQDMDPDQGSPNLYESESEALFLQENYFQSPLYELLLFNRWYRLLLWTVFNKNNCSALFQCLN